jgi:23S rRNA (cytidine1920-2'-O)/16S rRNA (cytidine1409-2'-O)-methyltransferase
MRCRVLRERLDKLVVERKLLQSREKAKAFILGGGVSVNGETVRTPSRMIDTSSEINLVSNRGGYVSRGGLKLEKALEEFEVRTREALCLDIGASTGGFTDCLLKQGAAQVVAVDVGRNQIAYSLRKDRRVRLVEGFNGRYIDRLELDREPDVVTIDVSFISIRLILKPLRLIILDETDIVTLLKPQFELDTPFPGFKGVVHERAQHGIILHELHEFFHEAGYGVLGYTFSPLRGPKGNIEFFAHLRPKLSSLVSKKRVDEVVEEAHYYFSQRSIGHD